MAVARGALVGLRGVCFPALLWFGLVCSNALLGSLSIRFVFFFFEEKHIKNKTVQRQTAKLFFYQIGLKMTAIFFLLLEKNNKK
jgi:hypothetical protein